MATTVLCGMKYNCGCIGGQLSHDPFDDGTDTYSFENDNLTVRGAGEMRMAGSGDGDDCYCDYSGTAYLYKNGITDEDDAGYDRRSANVNIRIHSSLAIYIDVHLYLPTPISYRYVSNRATSWVPLYWSCTLSYPCIMGAFAEDNDAWPCSSSFTLRNSVNYNDTITFSFSTNRDICKSICETYTLVDEYDNSYPANACGDSAACPYNYTIPWPWHKSMVDPSGVVESVIQDEDGNDIELYKSWQHNREPFFDVSDYGDSFSLDILDIGRGWTDYSYFDVNIDDWWVIGDLNGWSASKPTSCPEHGWYEWTYPCEDDIYYYERTSSTEPVPDLPYLDFTLPCGCSVPDDIFAYGDSGGVHITLADITAVAGNRVKYGTQYLNDIQFRVNRGKFTTTMLACRDATGIPQLDTPDLKVGLTISGASPNPGMRTNNKWLLMDSVTLNYNNIPKTGLSCVGLLNAVSLDGSLGAGEYIVVYKSGAHYYEDTNNVKWYNMYSTGGSPYYNDNGSPGMSIGLNGSCNTSTNDCTCTGGGNEFRNGWLANTGYETVKEAKDACYGYYKSFSLPQVGGNHLFINSCVNSYNGSCYGIMSGGSITYDIYQWCGEGLPIYPTNPWRPS